MMRSWRIVVSPAVMLALVLAAVGCGSSSRASGDRGRPATDPRSVGFRAVNFQASAGTTERVVHLGALRLTAACHRASSGLPLRVGARTSIDNAVIGDAYNVKGDPGSPYIFVLKDFDRSYGAWDPLGVSGKIIGTIHYSRPDGGQVIVDFMADEGTAQGDCIFVGTASYTPA
jgi:hypothetical protein